MSLSENTGLLATHLGNVTRLLVNVTRTNSQVAQGAAKVAADAYDKASANEAAETVLTEIVAGFQAELIRWADRVSKLELWCAEKGYIIPQDAGSTDGTSGGAA